jgi:transcriptional regulator of aromatic amino acid metabolism
MDTILTTFFHFLTKTLELLENTFALTQASLILTCITFILKTFIFYSIIKNRPKSIKFRISRILLIFVLIGAMAEDVAWFLRTLHYFIIPSLDYRIVRASIRLAWSLEPIRYNALGLFLEYSVSQNYKITLRQKVLMSITSCFSIFFIIRFMTNFNCEWHRLSCMPEIICMRILPLFSTLIILPLSLRYAFKTLSRNKVPQILVRQTKIVAYTLCMPNIIIDLFQIFPLDMNVVSVLFAPNSYTSLGLSNILLTYMIYYCTRKMVGLRFLNIKNHVQSTKKFNFIDDFKAVLEQLGKATTMQEITFTTQEVFHKAFNTPIRATILHSCAYQSDKEKTVISTAIDNALSSSDNQLSKAIHDSKILIYDEIAFNNFYEQDEQSSSMLKFLDNIGAEICIPIYNQQKVIGCIIVERGARQELYGNVERDEMIVFAQYLGNIINLLQNRNLENIYALEKEMREELFSKHQEINQYKESMRSFLHNNKHSRVGIIFYKNRQFVFGNREAQEIVDINLNVQIGHPFAKACRKVVTDVAQFQTTQTVIATDDNDNKIVINGMPYLERTHVILVLYYPEATDLIAKQLNQLKDPSAWDYLLYLETTQTGQFINQLIPSNSSTLLNFKIELLKIALSTKASLLDMPSEDLWQTVELLHHVSLRSQLETITLDRPQTTPDLTIKLFGLNPLFGMQSNDPLLKKLDTSGTIFIQNIHFLNIETQEYLAEFIHHGFFRIYKSDQKILCNTRIICSSNRQLEQLTREGKFSPLLLKELQKTMLVMPALNTLTEDEIDELANGFFQQALADKTFEKILEFDKRDLKRIIDSRPVSLLELKKRVQSFLTQKSRTKKIDVEKTFDPAYQVTDPDLIEIARLGKHALKDEKAMTILWNKFKNQNKIATFLGVNRSSVNRRCKDYNLIDY